MTSTATLIGPNPTTTTNGTLILWDAARKGKASAQGAVRRLKARGSWDADTAADLLDGYTRTLEKCTPDTPDYYRWAAARAFVIAASA